MGYWLPKIMPQRRDSHMTKPEGIRFEATLAARSVGGLPTAVRSTGAEGRYGSGRCHVVKTSTRHVLTQHQDIRKGHPRTGAYAARPQRANASNK